MSRKRQQSKYFRGRRSNRLGSKTKTVEGILHFEGKKSSAFLYVDEERFEVRSYQVHEAMDGDRVQARVFTIEGKPFAAVVGVLERATKEILGVFHEPAVIVPLDERIKRDFFVAHDDKTPELLDVKENDVVVASIVTYPTKYTSGIATLLENRGSDLRLDIPVELAIVKSGIPCEFSESVMNEAHSLVLDVETAMSDPFRKDVSDECCVTVDPVDAKDFDDAVFAQKQVDGSFDVHVHIADVSHYVHYEDAIDLEAQRRGFSAYLVDRVIPMLPEELSNELCSLKPLEKRLAMSVDMHLDSKGHVMTYDVHPSLIKSKARLSYNQVDEFIQTGEFSIDSLYKTQIQNSIEALLEVASLRKKIHKKRGAIEFETPEVRVLLDDQERPYDVVIRRPTEATEMIEHAMLLANECVGELLAHHDISAAYRVHEAPDPDALWKALPILQEFDLLHEGEAMQVASGNPFIIQEILKRSKNTAGQYLVSSLLLRCQSRAIYRPQNEGHYALGADTYCHFTSPIRRYPDVIVHRKLKAYLKGELNSKHEKAIDRKLSVLCTDCSVAERKTTALSRDTQRIKLAEMYKDRIGEAYSGIISGVTTYGMFVMLDDTLAEGLLPVAELKDDWYDFDETALWLKGQNTGKTYRMGQRVAVAVKLVDVEKGRIDFILAKDAYKIPAKTALKASIIAQNSTTTHGRADTNTKVSAAKKAQVSGGKNTDKTACKIVANKHTDSRKGKAKSVNGSYGKSKHNLRYSERPEQIGKTKHKSDPAKQSKPKKHTSHKKHSKRVGKHVKTGANEH